MASPYPPARVPAHQVVSYLRKKITFQDAGKALVLGTLPAGSLILRGASGVQVLTAFNAGTTNTVAVATTSGTSFGAAISLATATNVALGGTADVTRLSADATFTITPTLSGTAATGGEAEVYISFISAEG